MNGIPVYPHPKNGERPYLATPKPGFSDPIFGRFWRVFVALSFSDYCFRPLPITPNPMTAINFICY